jgi:hypothetical protein
MNIESGIRLLEEIEGVGPVAEKGDSVVYNLRAFLSKGDEISINDISPDDRQNLEKHHPEILNRQDGFEFINFTASLGKRHACAGVEHTLIGMKQDGYRKVKVSPHLAYRDEGIPGKVPANAVITFQIWLRKITYKAEHPVAPYSEPAARSPQG